MGGTELQCNGPRIIKITLSTSVLGSNILGYVQFTSHRNL